MRQRRHKQKVLQKDKLILQLYVSGMSERSMLAIENIRKFCDIYLQDSFELEIVDIYKHPEVASEQHIIFSPSLIKRYPLPQRTLIGTFSDTDKVMKGLGLTHKQ